MASGEALTEFPPPATFGVDGDIAVGPDGRVLRKVSGAWVAVELVIPAPTGLSAVYTIVEVIPGTFVTFYDLKVTWTGEGNYLAEVDVGVIQSGDIADQTGAVWGDLDGLTAGDAVQFRRLQDPSITELSAVRVRFIGSFGQRGPWGYAFYSTEDTLAIDSFAADNTEVESGDTVTLTWTIRNATSASIDQGVGALSSSQLESGRYDSQPDRDDHLHANRYGWNGHGDGERDRDRGRCTGTAVDHHLCARR